MMSNPLTMRTMSGFPISIGTALAMESLFLPRQQPYDPERKIPDHVSVQNYKSIYISLATLFRNIAGAVDKEILAMAKPKHFAEIIEAEMELIHSLFEIEGQGYCQPVYYFADYHSLYKRKFHQAVRFRQDQTPAQKHISLTMVEAIKEVLAGQYGSMIQVFDSEFKTTKTEKSLILTHIPYDLLNYNKFEKLDLIESHTGKLKSRSLWYTKYYKIGNEELNTLPFIRKLLLIFGDHVMIQPMDIRFRRLILEISRKRRWNPLTTQDRIIQDLNLDIQERYLYDMFMTL